MKVIGIVAEYNPFHLGHAYHIQQSKKKVGGDCAVVAVMSGNFVQRGEAAILPKHIRAAAAVQCGCDLVIELPLPWALSSAEGFARGGIGLLCAFGVDHISFGSESGNLEAIKKTASCLLRAETMEAVRKELKRGSSFAVARETVLRQLLGESAAVLASPNDLLAVEYCKTVLQYRPEMQLLPVLRCGAAHDTVTETGFRSASDLRETLQNGNNLVGAVPDPANALYEKAIAEKGIITQQCLESALLSRLRQLDAETVSALPDAGEGLENRFARACAEGGCLEEIYQMTKSKRYTLSRIRRMTLCAALGISKEMAAGMPPYGRVLAANARGRAVLRQVPQTEAIPILTKPAAAQRLSKQAQQIFALECAATDLYVLGYEKAEHRRGGSEWRTSPVML